MKMKKIVLSLSALGLMASLTAAAPAMAAVTTHSMDVSLCLISPRPITSGAKSISDL